jgi:hypothetical protein
MNLANTSSECPWKLSDAQHRYSITSSAVASSSRGKASHARVGYFA